MHFQSVHLRHSLNSNLCLKPGFPICSFTFKPFCFRSHICYFAFKLPRLWGSLCYNFAVAFLSFFFPCLLWGGRRDPMSWQSQSNYELISAGTLISFCTWKMRYSDILSSNILLLWLVYYFKLNVWIHAFNSKNREKLVHAMRHTATCHFVLIQGFPWRIIVHNCIHTWISFWNRFSSYRQSPKVTDVKSSKCINPNGRHELCNVQIRTRQ